MDDSQQAGLLLSSACGTFLHTVGYCLVFTFVAFGLFENTFIIVLLGVGGGLWLGWSEHSEKRKVIADSKQRFKDQSYRTKLCALGLIPASKAD